MFHGNSAGLQGRENQTGAAPGRGLPHTAARAVIIIGRSPRVRKRKIAEGFSRAAFETQLRLLQRKTPELSLRGPDFNRSTGDQK